MKGKVIADDNKDLMSNIPFYLIPKLFYYFRFVVREEDYRKVIERLENDLRGRVMNDTGERNQYEIKNLYG